MSSEQVVPLRLALQPPFDAAAVFGFLGLRAVPGVESWDGHAYRRALRLPHGDAVLSVHAPDDRAGHGPADGLGTVRAGPVGGVGPVGSGGPARAWLSAEVVLADPRDREAARRVARRLFDLGADPGRIDAVLGADPLLAPLVRRRPGVRVPGAVEGSELLVRAVLGQQISVVGARTLAGRLVERYGEPLRGVAATASPAITHRFPTAAALAGADPADLPLPGARARSLVGACAAIAEGRIDLDLDRVDLDLDPVDRPASGHPASGHPGAGRAATIREQLLSLPGIGPWTADYVLLRGPGRRDRFLAGDLVIRRSLERLGVGPAELAATVARWAPWQAYAVLHLWLASADEPAPVARSRGARRPDSGR